MILLVVLRYLKFVTYAPYGLERPLVGNAFKLFTKPFNVNVDSS